MSRPGPKMLAAIDHVRRNPGGPKISTALYCAPYGETDQPGLRFGYRVVDRAIAAGLLNAERLPGGSYSLTVTEAGVSALRAAGWLTR